MGISKIGYLFAANVDALGGANQAKTTQQQQQSSQGSGTQTSASSTEAAVVSATFGQTRRSEGEVGRETRVQELKALVTKGEYKPSSPDVAVAVIRDLA